MATKAPQPPLLKSFYEPGDVIELKLIGEEYANPALYLAQDVSTLRVVTLSWTAQVASLRTYPWHSVQHFTWVPQPEEAAKRIHQARNERGGRRTPPERYAHLVLTTGEAFAEWLEAVRSQL
jgi:hypothetical protein